MKKSLLLLLGVIFAFSTQAQVTGMEVELVTEHDGVVGTTDLTGFSTYRVYVTLENNDDFLSAIFGLAATPMNISSSTSFFHHPAGGNTSDQILPAVFPTIPEVEFDSWLTIGKTDATSPGNAIQVAQDPSEPWMDTFAAGNNIVIDGIIGGAWFTLFGVDAVNALPDVDGKVLIGQFTTDGVLTGSINGQVFVGSDQQNSQEGICFPFSSDADAIFGCTDPIAQNYNADADVNDCSCDYECVIAIDEVITTQTTCPDANDGSAQIIVSGQYGGVDYSLDGNDPVAVNNFNNLAGGPHTISVTDTEGCVATLEFEVPAPDPIVVTISLSDPISCNGDADAVITGMIEGGNGGFTVSLSEDLSDPTDMIDFGDLGPGLYTVYTIDENGCTGQSQPLNITQPLAVSANFGNTADATCSDSEDGVVVAVGFGGTGTLEYSIDGVNFQASNIFDVAAGDYTLTVQDQNGCSDVTENTITIGAPDAIALDATVTQPNCFGDDNGAISGMAMGGNGGFSYSINGEDPVAMLDLADLANGSSYTIVVTDVEGCVAEFAYTMNDPDEVTASLNANDPLCAGDANGEIVVIAAGGTEEYTYSIDGGNPQAEATFDGLGEGSYDVEVIDSNGCTATASASLTEPDAISVADVTTSEESAAGANDGSIDITVEGGTGSYDFDWTGDGGYSSDVEDPNDLAGGDYSVTITDENGCSITEDYSVATNIFELAAGVEFFVAPNPTNGTFYLNVSGLNGQAVAYRILDMSGRVIANNQLNGTQAELREEIDIAGAANGLYFLNLQVGESMSTIRVVKQ